MAIYTVRRLASNILGVGENKVKIKPDAIQRATEALTRADVQAMITEGLIFKGKMMGKRRQTERRRKTEGSRRGRKLRDSKEEWMRRVRSQRKYLVELLASNILPKEHKRAVYMKIKSGIFKSKRTMFAYLKDNSLVKDGVEMPKKIPPQKKVQPVKSSPEKAPEKPATSGKPEKHNEKYNEKKQ